MLPDVLSHRLTVVFCGTAVGTKSAERGAYYAGPGNQFWTILRRTGLTPMQIASQAFRTCLNYGIGLTDLVKSYAGDDAGIPSGGFDCEAFRGKIETCQPRSVAFNGKRAAEVFLNRKVEYGRQNETIGSTILYALPSTSGAARRYWDESHWVAFVSWLHNAIS